MYLKAHWVYGKKVNRVINAIENFGCSIRFVGGCIRDTLLQREVHDIDLATNLLPNRIIDALKLDHITAVPTGIKHGTVTAVLDGKSFEITTLRQDIKCDGRHAEVNFTDDWQTDASRRDFTFNALYADKHGNIYDYFHGIEDLKNRQLNFIGNAEDRIKEDYLRILRAFRFHADICIGNLSDEIIEACSKHSDMLKKLSGERIRDEIFKLLESKNPVPTLKIMQKFAILQKIIPEEVRCEILSTDAINSSDSIVKLALLLSTIENPKLEIGEYVSKFLCLSNKQKKKLLFLLHTNIPIELSELEQKKYLCLFGRELYCDLIKVHFIKKDKDVDVINRYISFANSFYIPLFPISGKDLISIGHQPGKNMGTTLALLKNYWESSSYKLKKDELLSYAKKRLT
ncbi:CCA tRNA nucleotidyltransferase [Wolbachia endosymbiont of Pentidionis agamae]|uniref:CCA tRNA nucleotidyltransferase n=1 Tax=Wolbachia endosymbiont of Pentidionis agamae TaxID=3110435 RepID=UPI002FD3CEA2